MRRCLLLNFPKSYAKTFNFFIFLTVIVLLLNRNFIGFPDFFINTFCLSWDFLTDVLNDFRLETSNFVCRSFIFYQTRANSSRGLYSRICSTTNFSSHTYKVHELKYNFIMVTLYNFVHRTVFSIYQVECTV